MNAKQDQAYNRVLRKLSALRVTLKADERYFLDALITGGAEDAAAHAMKVDKATPARTPSEDEAAAHVRTFKVLFDAEKNEYRREQ